MTHMVGPTNPENTQSCTETHVTHRLQFLLLLLLAKEHVPCLFPLKRSPPTVVVSLVIVHPRKCFSLSLSPKLSVWREIFLSPTRRPNQFGLSQPASSTAEIRYLPSCRMSMLRSLSQLFRVCRGTDHPGKIDCGTRLR